MNAKSPWKRTLGILNAALMFAASGVLLVQAQQKQNPNFTGGTVTPIDDKEGNIAHFRFEPGARTKWHSHERGQIILVEEGIGRTQVKGGPVLELQAGETTYAGPGVVHWHGAGPDKGGVQYNISRGGITWLQEVTDQEFRAPAKRLSH
jgi:quercetin dioxygenase-like cupin family protein